jgi:hypothetical protein
MIVVLPLDAVEPAIESLSETGIVAELVGEVVPVEALGGRRYAEGPLESVGDR